jgi:tetratricopeptide (TPR) repeat protein
MEHVALPTLAERLAQLPGPMEREEFSRRAEALLEAVGAVHGCGYVHCDLKPENAFSSLEPSQTKLFDFGLVRPVGAATSDEASSSNTIAGTPEYMSPEECEALVALDHRADIYALGIILYEMWTARPPFWGAANDVRQAHVARRPKRPSEWPGTSPELDEVILRCLEKERDRRFPNALSLREQLAAALRGTGTSAAPSSAAKRSPRGAKPGQAKPSRPMGLLFFESTADASALQSTLGSYGGTLAHLSPPQIAAVFDSSAAENPVRRAVGAAHALVARNLARRALVDLGSVTSFQRADGSMRYVGALFTQTDRYPRTSDPEGVLLTSAALELVPELDTSEVAARHGIVAARLQSLESNTQATVVRQGRHPLVGRAEVLKELLESAATALSNRRPSVSVVTGDVGHGKSRLCAEIEQALSSRFGPPQVFSFRAREPVEGEAGQSLRSLVQRLLKIDADAPPPKDAGKELISSTLGAQAEAIFWPALSLSLGWMTPDSPELRSAAAAPGVLRALVTRAAGEALRVRAQSQPFCVLLDDAHYADDLALDALEYAALAEARAPIWICVVARPAFLWGRPSFGERAAHQRSIQLDPLQPKDAVELCRELLSPADNLPEAALRRLVERTGGIPFLLVELVRGLKRDGLVRRAPGTDSWSLATDELDSLPDLPLLTWLARREIDALPPELASHARLTALLGPQFGMDDPEGVLRVLEREGGAADFPLEGRVATRRLLTSGLLIKDRRNDLRFRNALFRDELARSIPEALFKSIHLAAFQYYRDRGVEAAATRPLLAFHAAHAGLNEEATNLYLELAEEARARHAYFDAERMYTRALDFLPQEDGSRRLIAFRGRGAMRYRIGRQDNSLEDFSVARAIAETRGEPETQIEILLDEATALDWMQRYQDSRALVERAESLLNRSKSPVLEIRVRMGLGRSSFRFSNWAEASALLEEAATRAESFGDEAYETSVVSLLLLGLMLPIVGRIDDAAKIFDHLIHLCEQRGDLLHLSAAVNNRYNLWVARGDIESAARDLERKIQIGRELGVAQMEWSARYNLGEVYYQANKLDPAWVHVNRAVEMENRYPALIKLPMGTLLAARILAFQGEEQRARECIAAIRAHQAKVLEEKRTAGTLMPREDVLLTMVDLATREATDAEWEALQARSDQYSAEQEPIEVLEMRGLSAFRRGRHDEAITLLEKALQVASKIPNLLGSRIRGALENAKGPDRQTCRGP